MSQQEVAKQYESLDDLPVTRKVKIRLEIGADGTVEDVQVYNYRDSCNYMGSKTPEQIGEAVADFLRDYLPEVKWE